MSRNKSEYALGTQEDDDPYAQFANQSKPTMNTNQKESSRQRKWREFTSRWGDTKGMLKTSFLMGCMVGGGFGAVIGTYYAITTRRFLILPLSIISSGISFGFFLTIGSVVRSSDYKALGYENFENRLLSYNIESGRLEYSQNPAWMAKYSSDL